MRVLLALVVVAGLAVHIGLGYRLGLVIAGAGLVGHLALGAVARMLLRRKGEGARGVS